MLQRRGKLKLSLFLLTLKYSIDHILEKMKQERGAAQMSLITVILGKHMRSFYYPR